MAKAEEQQGKTMSEEKKQELRSEFADLQARVLSLTSLSSVFDRLKGNFDKMPDVVAEEAPKLLNEFEQDEDIDELVEETKEAARESLKGFRPPFEKLKKELTSLRKQLQENREQYCEATGVDEAVLNRMIDRLKEIEG